MWAAPRTERTLEPLLGVQVDLLSLSDVLEDLLHDRTIPVARITVEWDQGGAFSAEKDHVPRGELNVVVALDDVDVELLLAWRKEGALLDTKLGVR